GAFLTDLLEKFSALVEPVFKDLVQAAVEEAENHGRQAAIVGGVVRDLLLGQKLHDVDMMIEPPVAPIAEALARRTNASLVRHDPFLTFTLQTLDDHRFDIVTAREETYDAPAKLPTVKASTIENDLSRRDFSINAIACRLTGPKAGELLDPFQGQ